MTCLADRQYTLGDFDTIYKSIINDTNIDERTIQIINLLAQRVGAPEYQRTPVFKKRHNENRHSRRSQSSNVISNEDWQEMRNFKTTKLEKNDKGIEKEMDSLRMLLNKITSTNYHDIKNQIIVLLTKIIDSSPTEEELIKVGESIFEIGCLNKFWAKLYAELYKDLMEIFPVMNDIYKKNFATFLSLFDSIRFVSAEEDYDKFCEINKENQKRRAVSSFFVHLMTNKVVGTEKVMNIINILIQKFNNYIDQDNKYNEVDEIGGNLCILIEEGKDILEKECKFDNIFQFINTVADMDHHKYKSLTSKVVFKFMDLLDNVNC